MSSDRGASGGVVEKVVEVNKKIDRFSRGNMTLVSAV